ncbi:hypothetical protein B5X24_HaOG203942 [Helicoverpa armigera]|uniref:FLYWCH-type domain-containing protein n=1 Tax=Helicoverpa armigera TaxID=29058 RepID=A0A2W1BRP8_HELAM|nr:hypothetical protein B5X24_HaOG203942 [Helicoverpa armigera]
MTTINEKIEPMNEVTQQKDETKLKEKDIPKSAENKQNEATTSRQENKVIYEEPKRNDDEEVEEEYLVQTPRGCFFMVNNYKFHKKRQTDKRVEWRCAKRKTLGCKATVTTIYQTVVKRGHHEHNH